MVNLVLKFVGIARTAGLRIATSEVLDCLKQMQLVDIAEEPQFAAVLRANFAKSRREQRHFNRLYQIFFHELRQDASIVNSEPLAQQVQDILKTLAPAQEDQPNMQTVLDFLDGNPLPYFEQLQQIGYGSDDQNRGPGANLGALTQRLEIMLALNAADEALEQFLADHREQLDWEMRRDLDTLFKSRLDTARRLLTQDHQASANGADRNIPYRQRLDQLGEIHFASLTQKEVAVMREVIEQLVRKLKDTISRRYAKRNRGVLDIKKTLRRAAGYQGIPMELYYRHRPLRKSKIVALCDVSGSVWSAARFMLNMLYSLQECFTQVRSFVFVAGLDEVTHVFEDFEINQAIEKILKGADIEYNAATDYGLTFRQFKNRHLDMLNKKTTLIIIGDGRTNYGNPEAGILDDMRDRSRRVIWLNPETPYFWYTGDSEMRTYMEYCDEVRPCQNLNQLLEFIESLVL
ncbi:MAG: VWA domain-containing protein [Deltaproteobacteria bacterium]|nr:VWA domain-containing protein [Deltaproteobacteria bacterium]